ncbi:MAG: hypothetical protein GY757_07650, partial [bacterium]|nr:hypothetical protein [bacterium]
DVYRSGISECIEKVEGVDQVFIQSVSRDNGVQTDNKGNLILPGKTAATYPGKHIITILKEKDNICKPTTSPDSEGV